MARFTNFIGVLSFSCILLGSAAWGINDNVPSSTVHTDDWVFDPVDIVAPSPRIRISRLGSYRNGWFSKNTPTPLVYDPWSRRLFFGCVNRGAILGIDISDPNNPTRVLNIPVDQYGDKPIGLDLHRGVLLISIENEEGRDNVVFFNTRGQLLAGPIEVDAAGRIGITPNGRMAMMPMTLGLDEDTADIKESKIAIFDLKRANWGACRWNAAWCRLDPRLRDAEFKGFDKAALEAAGVDMYLTDLVGGILAWNQELTLAQEMAPEAFVFSRNSRYAYVTLQLNNAIAKVDLKRGKVLQIKSVGSSDHSQPGFGMDVSDRDGAINIANWPLRSLPHPDKIGLYRAGWHQYLVTVNEGDTYDATLEAGTTLPNGDVLKEDVDYEWTKRVEDLDNFDPVAFPNAEELQEKANMGRLEVSQLHGFTRNQAGDKIYHELYAVGSRSMSIFNLRGEKVSDTGEGFERALERAAVEQGLSFNSAEDNNEFDSRSRKKGAEPEPLALAKLGRHTFAFVGFERTSGVIVYDITDPREPKFQQYINNRNFAIEPEDGCGEKDEPALSSCPTVGDFEVEDVLFIPAIRSPIRKPLLAVNHEASDSTTLYRIDLLLDRDDD